ncbi:MAG: shikimate dehydrogenase [Nitrospira sp.]|nr:shikimate dehydrogenase [Nitrospira sp.]MDE0485725.1 shikimate dehydrogenase [Nitrospira sp.]
MEINTDTQLCGVLGHPVKHSLSPAIHNAAFQHLGLNYVYLAFPVEDVPHAIHGIRALGNLKGFSVTIPHKVSVMAHLDTIEPTARHIGAVNTIVKDEQTLSGYNTDASGALLALQHASVALDGKHVVMIGSGGAARAIAFGLALETPINKLTILGVEEDERQTLARNLHEGTTLHVEDHPLNADTLEPALDQAQVLIHCTPVGMDPHVDQTCVPQQFFHPDLTVMDIVYNPLETRLLKEARNAGSPTIRGLEMFLHQAVAQFELWTGQPAPVPVMRQVLESRFSSPPVAPSPPGREPAPDSIRGSG